VFVIDWFIKIDMVYLCNNRLDYGIKKLSSIYFWYKYNIKNRELNIIDI
jgi:hypothetical protein